jgi:LPS export ABC transporter protein LptC
MIKSRLFWILSIILAISTLFILSYREQNVSINPSFKESSMKYLHLINKSGNDIRWELSATEATIPEDKKKIFLQSPSLRINNSPEIHLTSGNGIYEVEKDNVTLSRPVEINIKDAIFETDTLTWNSKDELISTDDPVQIKGNNYIINGTGLTAHVTQHKVRILNNVKAVFYN